MRLLIIIVVVTLSGYTNSKTPVPQEIQEYIKNHLPGWSIVDTADYAKSWWSFYDRRETPFFITVDINDDQSEDHAVLLKRSNVVRLVILIGSGSSFTHQFAEDFLVIYKGGVRNVQHGLTIEPPGQIDVLEPKEASLILRSNAITLMEIEERSRIYYWSDGTIKTFYAK